MCNFTWPYKRLFRPYPGQRFFTGLNFGKDSEPSSRPICAHPWNPGLATTLLTQLSKYLPPWIYSQVAHTSPYLHVIDAWSPSLACLSAARILLDGYRQNPSLLPLIFPLINFPSTDSSGPWLRVTPAQSLSPTGNPITLIPTRLHLAIVLFIKGPVHMWMVS